MPKAKLLVAEIEGDEAEVSMTLENIVKAIFGDQCEPTQQVEIEAFEPPGGDNGKDV